MREIIILHLAIAVLFIIIGLFIAWDIRKQYKFEKQIKDDVKKLPLHAKRFIIGVDAYDRELKDITVIDPEIVNNERSTTEPRNRKNPQRRS